MKKFFTFTLAAAALLIIAVPLTWAQESGDDEFILEDVVVTAEKREVNVQDIPASVQALVGADLVEQGKTTVGQMLEDVPNLVYYDNPRGDRGGPLNNIVIRGIKRTQEAGGPGVLASTTSVYVDGVFEGIGYSYDIDRVEVLRGPQGTLYGRSSTSGVVAFHTKNPRLGEFSGNLMTEYGSGDRINTQGAINVPIGDKVALRAAFHYLHQDEAYLFDDPGGGNETKSARIKALLQPNDQFSAVLSFSTTSMTSKSGGWFHRLTGPDEINWQSDYAPVGDDVPNEFEQASLEVNYDLGDSALTYIGAIHTHENIGKSGVNLNRGFWAQNHITGEPAETQTHEIRWASGAEGRFSWLIGANHYEYTYNRNMQALQASVIGDDDPDTFDAPVFGEQTKGDITNYGIFTEETFELRDDMRITAGLRFDKTEMNIFMGQDFNLNLKANGAALNPPINLHFPEDGDYLLLTPDFDNWTYKLRFEYDLTPDNMLYATTATGFQPGSANFTVLPEFGIVPSGGFGVIGANFVALFYQEQQLTSYELGSKNRFLDDRLRVNGALFFMDYEGYQEALQMLPPGQPPPPKFVKVSLPVEIYGLEMDLEWLLTQYDRVTFTAGWQDTEVTSIPDAPLTGGEPGEMISPEPYMYLMEITGIPDLTFNLAYDHTFLFDNGSSLVPRAELRYTSGYYLGQATDVQAAEGWLPDLYRDDLFLLNMGVTWHSPQEDLSITGYVRNATDEVYKTSVALPAGPPFSSVVEVGDPLTFGILLNYRF